MPSRYHEVTIDKLVHGGQGIGSLQSGKRVLVWGVLPGEHVKFLVTKTRKDFVEGVAEEIISPSADRLKPEDELYLSTSPWQIMSYQRENEYKKAILCETLQRAGVDFDQDIIFEAPEEPWHYRNKMEYSFWGDDSGLHLALFNRGTHHKQIVTGSSISRPEIDKIANKLCDILNKHSVRAGDLKSVIVRCSQAGETVVALFTRNKSLPKMTELAGLCKGLVVVFSDPKSPASVRTQDLYSHGDISLTDKILDTDISYDVFSFFQVNLPIFCKSLGQIKSAIGEEPVTDFYSGVGTIGLTLPGTKALVESDEHNIAWAKRNVAGKNIEVVKANSEIALDYIGSDSIVVDPPRAGLHKNLINKLLGQNPPKIVYLSCNPGTQARDLALLKDKYKIANITGYNFFPRTPHIESLAILVRK